MERSARVGAFSDVNLVSSAAGTVVISHDPGAIIDFSGLSDTTLLAYGYQDQIDLFDNNNDPGLQEGSGNTIRVLGDKSVVTTGDGGGNTIVLSGRNDTVAGQGFPGSQDTVQATSKGAVITVGGDSTVLLSGTDAQVSILGTRPGDSDSPLNDVDVVASGSGKATVTGGGAAFSFAGDTGAYVINGGDAEHATISGGAGSGVFTGGYYETPYPEGPGNGSYFYFGDNVVIAGVQRSTLVGSAHGSSTLIADGTAHDVLVAGEYGSDSMSAGNSTVGNLYEGYSGSYAPTDDTNIPSLVINAGIGNDTLVAGLAAETLTGGGGHNEFRFISQPVDDLPQGGNTTLITDFVPGMDKLDLRGFSETAQQVVASETVRGGSTSLYLTGGVQITLAHVTDLSVKDFTFSGS